MPRSTELTVHDASAPQGRTLRDVQRALRSNVLLVLGTTAALMAAAALATLLMTPRYQSEAMVRMGDRRPGSSMLGEETSDLAGIALLGLGENEIDTDIGVLQSREVLSTVADSLHLHVRLERPVVPRDSVLEIVRAPRDLLRGEYTLQPRPDGSYALRVTRDRRTLATQDGIRLGQRVRVGELVFALSPALRATPPSTVRFEVASFDETVEELGDVLRVSRATGRSRLVNVRYRSRDPELAARVVNGITNAFIRYKTESSRIESRSTVGVLREQVADYADQLRVAEDRLRSFREETRLASVEEQARAQVEQVLEFQAERDADFVERQALAGLLQRVRTAEGGERNYRELATFPSFLTHPGVQHILTSLITLENQRAELLVRRTAENRDVAALTDRIRELELQLYELGSSYLSSLEGKIAAADAMLARFDEQLAGVPRRDVEMSRLMREHEILAEVYTFLQMRLKEAEIQEAVERGDARVVDPALVAEEPVSPKPLVNLALAAVLGLLLGTAIVIGRDVSGPTIRTREDAIEAAGGLPLLGIVPAGALPRSNGARPALLRRRPLPLSDGAGPLLLASGEMADPGADAYRSLWASVSMAARDMDPRPSVLAVTGVGSAEEDPAAAGNLAVAFAQRGSRTLLVDADLRLGKRMQLLPDAPAVGLTDVVRGTVALDAATVAVDSGNPDHPLYWLPSGAAPRYPSELLAPDRLLEVLNALRAGFDIVVLHTPPVNTGFEGAVVSAAADATLLVARAQSTDRDDIRAAIAVLGQRRANILGIVLTGVTPSDGRWFSSVRGRA